MENEEKVYLSSHAFLTIGNIIYEPDIVAFENGLPIIKYKVAVFGSDATGSIKINKIKE